MIGMLNGTIPLRLYESGCADETAYRATTFGKINRRTEGLRLGREAISDVIASDWSMLERLLSN
jgi:hypothetical protein